MSFQWLKRYMPRSLYGRAALILVLPVVTLQLVVSVVFIQRHFEGVSVQLSRELARAVNLAVAENARGAEVFQALDLRLTEIAPTAVPDSDRRRWYDFTGIVVIRTLRARIDGLERIELPDDRDVRLYIDHGDKVFLIEASRGRVSATNPHQLLVNMVVFGLLMTLIAYVYLRNQLRPITRLAEASEAFGRGGTCRILPRGPSRCAPLVTHFWICAPGLNVRSNSAP